MGCLRVKKGCRFDVIDPAGFRILGALDRVVRPLPYDLTITCGTEGHPTMDPHTLGRAYDVRSHFLTPDQKRFVLRAVLLDVQETGMDAPMEVSGGWATMHFFGWLEHPGDVAEHFHFQQRKGVPFGVLQ